MSMCLPHLKSQMKSCFLLATTASLKYHPRRLDGLWCGTHLIPSITVELGGIHQQEMVPMKHVSKRRFLNQPARSQRSRSTWLTPHRCNLPRDTLPAKLLTTCVTPAIQIGMSAQPRSVSYHEPQMLRWYLPAFHYVILGRTQYNITIYFVL